MPLSARGRYPVNGLNSVTSHRNRILPRTHRRRPHRAGFTLIELAVVLAILVVVAAVGWGTMRSHLPRFRLVRAGKALKGDLMYLRNYAISSSRETRLRFVSTGGDCAGDFDAWGGAWALEVGNRSSASTAWEFLPQDAVEDGTDDDQSEGTVDLGSGPTASRNVCLVGWSEIGGPGSGNADAVVFSPRGRLTNPGSDFSEGSGWIVVDLVNQSAARQGLDDSLQVMVNRVGNVNLVSSLSDPSATATASR